MVTKPWVTSKKASELLGVSEQTLNKWREVGYLKPGTHWRSSPGLGQQPWSPQVIYHLLWCKEKIEYWRMHDAPLDKAEAA